MIQQLDLQLQAAGTAAGSRCQFELLQAAGTAAAAAIVHIITRHTTKCVRSHASSSVAAGRVRRTHFGAEGAAAAKVKRPFLVQNMNKCAIVRSTMSHLIMFLY